MANTIIPYSEFIGSHDPYPVLRTTAARIVEICHGLTEEYILGSPEPGKWSIHQILAHLADNELMAQVRVRLMLFENTPHLTAYDQDRAINGWMREKETFDQTLERFRVLRESTLRLFENTPESDLKRTGVHEERGVQSAGDYIVILAGHDINHLSQVEAIRTAVLQSR